jgi:hypothetical protein
VLPGPPLETVPEDGDVLFTFTHVIGCWFDGPCSWVCTGSATYFVQ